MRSILLAVALLTCTVAVAGQNVANISAVWFEPNSTAPVIVHGISRSCVTCPTPHSFINLSQTTYNTCVNFAGVAASPPAAADRVYFRSILPAIQQGYWDNDLASDDERDAVIEAYRIAPPW